MGEYTVAVASAVRSCALACALLACSSRASPPVHPARTVDGGAALHIGDPCRPEQGWLPDAGDTAKDPNASPPIGVGYCGRWREAPDGYYTARCTQNADCPDGARCGRGSYWCVARCRSNADCTPPASCHLSAAAAVSYCQVTGGVLARGDRDAGASDDCELPCGFYQTCCHAQCFDLANDPRHYGHCTHACGSEAPYCEDGRCVQPRCAPECDGGSTCCAVYGGSGPTPSCIALQPDQSCPSGCHDCTP